MAPTNDWDMQAFENTSTNVAASQMRNALNKLCDTVTDEKEKQVSILDILQPTYASNSMLAFRDRNGQLLCPLPTIPQR